MNVFSSLAIRVAIARICGGVSLVVAMSDCVAATTNSIHMEVVDSVTKQPIEGAVAHYSADVREGTITGHGGREANLFRLTATSDGFGRIVFAPQQFETKGFGFFGMNTNYESPHVVIEKLGYEPLRISNVSLLPRGLREVLQWDWNGKTFEMRRQAAGVGQAGHGGRGDFTGSMSTHHRLKPSQVLRVAPAPGGRSESFHAEPVR